MLELARHGASWQLGMGGDTFNTALYMQRLGVPTAYLTALGTDPFSLELRASWVEEGLDTSMVLSDAGHLPGLYAIRTDTAGERSFSYWRENSAARNLFKLPGIEAALERASQARLLYFSGITLSLFSVAQQEQLVEVAHKVRERGGQVAFDLNYRPGGWASAQAARDATERVASVVTWALPSHEDAATLFGDKAPEDTMAAWRRWGAHEVVVKLGARGCLVGAGGITQHLQPAAVREVVDTTGAGDSFNAGYLASRIQSKSPLAAAQLAQRLAAEVIQHRGAIVPQAAMRGILERL
jgi:2-dehydro-3-deoxygluconokinase